MSSKKDFIRASLICFRANLKANEAAKTIAFARTKRLRAEAHSIEEAFVEYFRDEEGTRFDEAGFRLACHPSEVAR